VLGELAENHPQAAQSAPPRARWRRPPARSSTASRRAPTPSASPPPACCRRAGPRRRRHAVHAGRGYILYGVDPQHDFADRRRRCARWPASRSSPSAPTPATTLRAVADLILPIGLLPEIEGTLTNLDGRSRRRAGRPLPGERARAGACCAPSPTR
jgi:NADH-quinone oxidoreductase subunit G